MTLQLKIAEERDMVILAFEGRMDEVSIDELNLGFDEVKRRGKKNIILMFRGLEHINSRGKAALQSFLKWAEQARGEVKIAEVQPNLMEVLKPLGLDTSTRIYDSLSDAMKSFRKGEGEEEMREEQEMVVDEDFRRPDRSEGSKMPLLLIAGGVFVLVILLIVYMTREGSSDLQPLQKKVTLLEQKIAQMEGQSKELAGIPGRIDGLRKDFTERSQQLEREVARLRHEMQSASSKAAPPAAPAPAKPAQKALKYHTVAKGETLFAISNKYGITLEELRRLNNLKANQSVGVGQKLIVGSP